MTLTADLDQLAVTAGRLQNSYALSIDTREWDVFRTLFTPEVHARYPHQEYHGIDDWLADFIPFHDRCTWTSHVMTTHAVGADDHGIWATCYGWVQWTHEDTPGRISRATVLFRDRLAEQDGAWRIARRKLDLLMTEQDVPIPAGAAMVQSVLDLADRS